MIANSGSCISRLRSRVRAISAMIASSLSKTPAGTSSFELVCYSIILMRNRNHPEMRPAYNAASRLRLHIGPAWEPELDLAPASSTSDREQFRCEDETRHERF